MDSITVVRVFVTVASMIGFVAFVVFAFSKKNAKTLEAVGQSIIDDDDSVQDTDTSDQSSLA